MAESTSDGKHTAMISFAVGVCRSAEATFSTGAVVSTGAITSGSGAFGAVVHAAVTNRIYHEYKH